MATTVKTQLEQPIGALAQSVTSLENTSTGMAGVAGRIIEMRKGYEAQITKLNAQNTELTLQNKELTKKLEAETAVSTTYKTQIEDLTKRLAAFESLFGTSINDINEALK